MNERIGGARREVQGVALLYKALRLIDAVAEAPEPPKVNDLLRRTGISRGTFYRLAQALIDHRYLATDQEGGYRLGTRVFDLSHRVWERFDLRGASAPELERLNQATGETVRLSVLSDGDVLYIDQREARGELRVASGVGGRAAPHASASGKAITAYLPPADQDRLLSAELEPFTPRTLTDPGALRREFSLIKTRGYALAEEERSEGLVSVAAPILNTRGGPLGAVALIGPAHRLPSATLHATAHDLIEAARRVAGTVGESPQTIDPAPRPLTPASPGLKCLASSAAFLGESPLWEPETGRLCWVDILSAQGFETDPATGSTIPVKLPHLTSALARWRDGVVVCSQDRVIRLDRRGGERGLVADLSLEFVGRRFNDAKVDREGRLWAGSIALDAASGGGRLHRIDGDGVVAVPTRTITVPNGLGWSPDDRTMYLADSAEGVVYAHEFDAAAGELGRERAFVRFPADEGRPGGLTIDAEGGVWVAHWDGWRVTRFFPDGSLDRSVVLPVPRPTSCALGGADGDTLFITTARMRLSRARLQEAPLSGSVFAISVSAPGLPEPMFGASDRRAR